MAIATSTAVALALAAAAAGTSYVNTRNTAKKQDREMARGIQERGKKQQLADAEVNKLIDKTAGSDADKFKGDTLAKYMDTIRSQQGNATSGLGQVGAVSDAYKKSGAEASLGISDYGTKIAGLLSRIDAPGLQRNQEAIDQGRFGSEIDRIKRYSAGDDFLSNLRMQGIRRNPWMDAFSSFAGGASSGMAGGGGG